MIVEIVALEGPEPIPLEAAKLHLRVVHDEEDGLIEGYISAARAEAEIVSRRVLAPQRLRLHFGGFPVGGAWLTLRPGPVTAITAVTYLDAAGVQQTLAPAALPFHPGLHACVGPGAAGAWPATLEGPDAVVVEVVAGYTAATVPAQLRQAMLLLLGDFYENRERTVMTPGIGSAANPAARRLLMIDRYV